MTPVATYSILGTINPISGRNYYQVIVQEDGGPWVLLDDGPMFTNLGHAQLFVAAYAESMRRAD